MTGSFWMYTMPRFTCSPGEAFSNWNVAWYPYGGENEMIDGTGGRPASKLPTELEAPVGVPTKELSRDTALTRTPGSFGCSEVFASTTPVTTASGTMNTV